MPLYHASAFQLGFHCCLIGACTLVLGQKFSVSNFWNEVAAADATAIQYVGETLRVSLLPYPFVVSVEMRLASSFLVRCS